MVRNRSGRRHRFHDNHLKRWPPQVIAEIVVAMTLMGFGPWCFLQGIRKSMTGR
jgi:hypothetical protein